MVLFLKKNFVSILIVFISLALFQKVTWIKEFFGERINYVEVLYNFTVNYDGIKDVPISFKIEFLQKVLLIPLLFSFFWVFLLEESKKNILVINFFQIIKKIKPVSVLLTFFYKLLLNYKVYLIVSIIFYGHKLDFVDFVIVNKDTTINKKLYVNPNDVNFIDPKIKKNIILLYVESLEYVFRDIDNINSIKKIDAIEGKNILNFKEAPATGFSAAGLISSQCSVPLYPSLSMSMTLLKKKELVCFSDVLGNHGYEQAFFITVPGGFHGFSNFKKNHGYTIYDKIKMVEDGLAEKRLTGWAKGVQDDDMLKYAKNKIIELHRRKQPFNATIITTDTHYPYIISPRCNLAKKPGAKSHDERTRSYQCTGIFLEKFFNDLKKEGILDNTVVVIMGDHLSSPAKIDRFPSELDRNIYFKMNTQKKFTRKKMNHYDVAPTLLQEMGFLETHDNRFGFGVSLFSNNLYDYENHYIKTMDKMIVSDFLINEIFNLSE
ncbi:LTA synthase family protein [Pelagibacteraceae bacterium]|jgi:phosphoglycerol transferase|nr:LTA synthase family protein [Pelagibacteraceae bacterium]